MVSSLVAGLVLVLGQDARRDVKLGVLSVEEFGKWVNSQTGELIIVSPEVAERDIYVNVRQRTLAELEEYVARAADLIFLRKNGSITILPASEKGDDRSLVDFEKKVAELGKNELTESQLRERLIEAVPLHNQINAQLSALEKYGFPNKPEELSEEQKRLILSSLAADIERFRTISSEVPKKIGLYDVLVGLGSDGLKQIKNGERVVFSTHPTSLQRPWPGDGEKQIEQINLEFEKRNQLVRGIAPKFLSNSGSEIGRIFSTFGGDENPAAAMHLVVQENDKGYFFELLLFDERGFNITSMTSQLNIDGTETSDRDKYTDLKGILNLGESDCAQLELVEELYCHPNNYFKEYQVSVSSDITQAYLAQIDQIHPLSGAVSTIFDFACESTGNELVTEVIGFDGFSDYQTVSAEDGSK